jgi:hypothetical protein
VQSFVPRIYGTQQRQQDDGDACPLVAAWSGDTGATIPSLIISFENGSLFRVFVSTTLSVNLVLLGHYAPASSLVSLARFAYACAIHFGSPSRGQSNPFMRDNQYILVCERWRLNSFSPHSQDVLDSGHIALWGAECDGELLKPNKSGLKRVAVLKNWSPLLDLSTVPAQGEDPALVRPRLAWSNAILNLALSSHSLLNTGMPLMSLDNRCVWPRGWKQYPTVTAWSGSNASHYHRTRLCRHYGALDISAIVCKCRGTSSWIRGKDHLLGSVEVASVSYAELTHVLSSPFLSWVEGGPSYRSHLLWIHTGAWNSCRWGGVAGYARRL